MDADSLEMLQENYLEQAQPKYSAGDD